MAQLRAYYLNGGDMLELVRYQKKELSKAVGAEYDVLSGEVIQRSERNGTESLENIPTEYLIVSLFRIRKSYTLILIFGDYDTKPGKYPKGTLLVIIALQSSSGLVLNAKIMYIKATSHRLIHYQSIVGELYSIHPKIYLRNHSSGKALTNKNSKYIIIKIYIIKALKRRVNYLRFYRDLRMVK